MGLCGLALAWRLAATEFGLPAWFGEVLGLFAAGVFVALTLCYGIKCVESPAAVRAEFAHPVAVNFFATPIISLLLLPAVVAPYSVALANALWVAGTVAMLGFAWLIVSRWMSVRQQVAHATPAWMIPVVGTLNISIAGVTLELAGCACGQRIRPGGGPVLRGSAFHADPLAADLRGAHAPATAAFIDDPGGDVRRQLFGLSQRRGAGRPFRELAFLSRRIHVRGVGAQADPPAHRRLSILRGGR